MDQNNVQAVKCPRVGHDCNFDRESAWATKGTWDIVFNQALVVTLENGQRFVTNFMYTLKPGGDESYKGQSWEITNAPAYEQDPFNFREIKDTDVSRFI